MKGVARAMIIVVGSLAYWTYAPLLPLGLRELFFPDCYVSAHPERCYLGGSVTQLGGFVAVGVIYSLLLWWALRLWRPRSQQEPGIPPL